MASKSEKTVDQAWEEFWKPIVCNEDGSVNIEQVKKELHDYLFVIEEVPKVYMHISGGILSKVNYHAEGVISKADEHYESLCYSTVREDIEAILKNLHSGTEDIIINDIKEYIASLTGKSSTRTPENQNSNLQQLKPHPDYDFVNDDKVFVENTDGTTDYFMLSYEPELAEWVLIPFADKHYTTPKENGEGRVVAEPLNAYGYELLNRVEEYEFDELP